MMARVPLDRVELGRSRLPGYLWDRRRRSVLSRDDGLCVKCDKPASEVDHVVPVALGGSDDQDNLQSLCAACHRLKTVQDLEKVRRAKKFKAAKSSITGGFD